MSLRCEIPSHGYLLNDLNIMLCNASNKTKYGKPGSDLTLFIFPPIVVQHILKELFNRVDLTISRTQYDPDMSLTGNAKTSCLGLILALF